LSVMLVLFFLVACEETAKENDCSAGECKESESVDSDVYKEPDIDIDSDVAPAPDSDASPDTDVAQHRSTPIFNYNLCQYIKYFKLKQRQK